jgi:hypothetical protein
VQCFAFFFHAYIGSDTVSSIFGIGKLKVQKTWKKLTLLSEDFVRLLTSFHISDADFEQIENSLSLCMMQQVSQHLEMNTE